MTNFQYLVKLVFWAKLLVDIACQPVRDCSILIRVGHCYAHVGQVQKAATGHVSSHTLVANFAVAPFDAVFLIAFCAKIKFHSKFC